MKTTCSCLTITAASTRRAVTAVVAALLLSSTAGIDSAWAQPPAVAPAAASAVDPKALAELKRMGEYLRTLKSFAVRADVTKDEVLDNGQKIQFGNTVDLYARRPDRMRADLTSDLRQRRLYYDGKTLTQYAPRIGYYASIPAPGTIREMVAAGSEKYGLEFPLADLFFWGTDQAGIDAITSAVSLGPSRIDGVETTHYAFRQDGVDWQLWIERGRTPLPRKLVITTLDEPSQPQYTSVLKWNLQGGADSRIYAFSPPKDARRIVMATDAAAK